MASKSGEDTLQHNIRVHLWPRRETENNFDEVFKFSTFSELNIQSNWIGNSQESVNNKATVKFQYPIYYPDPNFMLIPRSLMDELVIEMFKVYKDFYSNSENWFGNNPFITDSNKLFDYDPVFAQKVTVDNPESRIFFIGDIHSSLHSLIDILKDLKNNGVFVNDTSFELNGNCFIFFLGDLVDRGPYSVEVISLAFLLKFHNQENVFIINGNHEDRPMYTQKNEEGLTSRAAGFGDEIEYQFGEYEVLHQLMYALPSVIYLEFAGKRYHLSHGAIPLVEEENIKISTFLKSEKRFLLIKETPDHLHQLKWGDFKVEEGLKLSQYDRHQFGSDLITKYITLLGLECLITGHQDLEPLMILPIESISFEEVEVPNDINLTLVDFGTEPLFVTDEDFELSQLKEDVVSDEEDTSELSSEDINSSNTIIEKRLKEEISFNGNTFRHCNHPGISCTLYIGNFGLPVKYDLFKRSGPIERFDFEPENILALTTSTATIAKNIPANTYLELVAKNSSELRFYRSSIPRDIIHSPIPLRNSLGSPFKLTKKPSYHNLDSLLK